MDNTENKPVETPAETSAAPQDPAQEFLAGFKDLVAKTGYTIVSYPEFVGNQDGTFSVRVKSTVVKLKEEKPQATEPAAPTAN